MIHNDAEDGAKSGKAMERSAQKKVRNTMNDIYIQKKMYYREQTQIGCNIGMSIQEKITHSHILPYSTA